MKEIGILGIRVIIHTILALIVYMLLLLVGNLFANGAMAVTMTVLFASTVFPSFTDGKDFETTEILVIFSITLISTVFLCRVWWLNTAPVLAMPVYILVLLVLLSTRALCHETQGTISYIGTFSAIVIGLGLGLGKTSGQLIIIIGVIVYVINSLTLVLGPMLIKKFPKE